MMMRSDVGLERSMYGRKESEIKMYLYYDPPLHKSGWGTCKKKKKKKKKKIKELTEGHHQEWSLRLNLTQHGKTHQVQT